MKLPSLQTINVALLIMLICVIDCLATCVYWQHQAVVHNAAFWQSNTWGLTTFKWSDTASAQDNSQEEGWQKVQTAAFNNKLKSLGIQ